MGFKYFILVIYLSLITVKGFCQFPYTANSFCLDSCLRFGTVLKDSHKGIVMRDFNKDGFADLATVKNKTPNGKEIVFFTNNISTSTVSLFNEYTYNISSTPTGTDTNVNSISAGFINTDSLSDVLFIDNNNLNVFVNTTATTGINVPVTGSVVNAFSFGPSYFPYGKFIKTADFNLDKRTDVVVFTQNSSGQLVVMMLRNNSTLTSINFISDATFTVYPGSALLAAVQDCDISVNDFNSDSFQDILVMYRSVIPYAAYGFLNNSAAFSPLSFTAFTLTPQGTYPITAAFIDYKSVAIAKVNETDNVNDVVFGINIPSSNSIVSYLQNASGAPLTTSQTIVLPISGDYIKDLTLADLTGDRNKDLVVLTSNLSGSNRVLIYYYDPSVNGFNASFSSILVPANVDQKINELLVMDYNNDNRWDLVLKSWSKANNFNSEYIYLIPNFTNKSFQNPNNYAICTNTSIIITPTISYGGNNNYTWSLSTATNNPLSTSLTNTLFPPQTAGVNSYVFNFSYSLPYSGLSCNYKPLAINISPLVAPSVSLSANAPAVCSGDNIILNTSNSSAVSYTLLPLNAINSASVITTSTSNVTFTAIATSSNGCIATSTLQVIVYPIQKAEIATLSSYSICVNDSVNLKSNQFAYSYLWSNGSTNSSFYFKSNVSGIFLVSLQTTDTNYCKTDEDIIQISVSDCSNIDTLIKTYHLITPNKDGLNDFFMIDNIEHYPKAVVTIFNRWGATLFSKDNYNNTNVFWPATNENVIGGTYYYTITNNNYLIKKGWIEILKD